MNTENNILKLDTDVAALSEKIQKTVGIGNELNKSKVLLKINNVTHIFVKPENNEAYASAYRERMNIHV